MTDLFRAGILLLACSPFLSSARAGSWTDAVDPFIGSGGHGHVFVGACLPFGAVTPGPTQMESGWDWCSGYHWTGKYVRGFSPLHLSGTGCPDLADMLVMPVVGDVELVPGDTTQVNSGFYSTYSHHREACRPGYYEVFLDRYGVTARMTATPRVAVQEYVFPAGANAGLVIDVENGIGWNKLAAFELRQLDDSTVVGHRFSRGWAPDRRHYFVFRFSRPMTGWTTASGGTVATGDGSSSGGGYGIARFDVSQDTVVGVKVALSSVSVENAVENLEREALGRTFDAVREEADAAWNHALSRIEATFDDERTRRIFYTALYHTMIHPTLHSDCNGMYRGSDGETYGDGGFENYTTFSLWDTYRGLHPLFTLIFPDKQHDWAQSLIASGQQQGFLPIWPLMSSETGCMVGSPAVIVLADMCLKGMVKDVVAAYDVMKRSLSRDFRGLRYLNTMGYAPCDKVQESVSVTLENHIAFAAMARVAKMLGYQREAERYDSLSRAYVKLFDPSTGFFRGRSSTGEFCVEPFNPCHHTSDFTEGTAWQYLWLVPHDLEGLIGLLGGEAVFEQRLDSLFLAPSDLGENANPDISGLIGQYAHGNEPSHHVPYLYNYIGKPWKGARWIRRILDTFYSDSPDGLCGNEDAGEMSAWYVLSSLGFYPVDPTAGRYVIGSPTVKTATLDVGEGRKFNIVVHRRQRTDIYVESLCLNGKPYDKSYLEHADIAGGGTLEFYMASEPSRFGTGADERP